VTRWLNCFPCFPAVENCRWQQVTKDDCGSNVEKHVGRGAKYEKVRKSAQWREKEEQAGAQSTALTAGKYSRRGRLFETDCLLDGRERWQIE
jgi:hypothetical protein